MNLALSRKLSHRCTLCSIVVELLYKNDAAIVNLCRCEYIAGVFRKLLKEDILFPMYCGMSQGYGD